MTEEEIKKLLYKAGGQDDFQIFLANLLDDLEDAKCKDASNDQAYRVVKLIRDEYVKFKKQK